jgi:hypothetical protein
MPNIDAGGVASDATLSPMSVAGSFLNKAPVDLLGMANKLGISVDPDAPMKPDTSGRLIRIKNTESGFHIDLNGAHSAYRKRFTLAHELAHYLLHRDQIGDGVNDNAMYRSDLSDQLEVEANSLAAQILMPASLVRSLYRGGLMYLSGLSNAFQVSEEAMRIRLRQLRLGA